MKASEWAFDRIKEAFDLVAKDEVENMSIVKEIMLKSTDYLRRVIAPVGAGEGLQSACGAAGLVQKFDQRVEVVWRFSKKMETVSYRTL